MSLYLDYQPDAVDVRVAELLTATHDSADPLVDPKVVQALGLMREHLGMDVMFVSQIHDRKRTYRVVDAAPEAAGVVAGQSDPVEESFCQFVVDGLVPGYLPDAWALVEKGQLPDPGLRVGTYLSTPIRLGNGAVYGTLCCFSGRVRPDVTGRDLQRLEAAAKIIAKDLDRAADLQLQPMDDMASRARARR